MNADVIRVTKLFTFDMAHALYGYDGACKNIHGHTYSLFVTIRGKTIQEENNPKNGMVLDFSDLKKTIKELVLDKFDHALVLNGNSPHRELQGLKDQFERIVFLPFQPSCENLMLHFKSLIQPCFKDDTILVYLKLLETPTSYAEWYLSENS
jgi:6-pyruvoyltetrahydropterin/6-carboxytetrahydropterin synthase